MIAVQIQIFCATHNFQFNKTITFHAIIVLNVSCDGKINDIPNYALAGI